MMQNNVEIVPVQESHLAEVLQIERDTFSLPWSYTGFKAELDSPDSHFTVAVANGEVVGFCILRIFVDEGEIFNIAVKKEYRGLKIGDILLRNALEHADRVGVRSTFLEVRESNLPALNLYRKQGFEALCIRKDYYDEPTENAVIMRRNTPERN